MIGGAVMAKMNQARDKGMMYENYQYWLKAFQYAMETTGRTQRELSELLQKETGKKSGYGTNYLSAIINERVSPDTGRPARAGVKIQPIISKTFGATYAEWVEIGRRLVRGESPEASNEETREERRSLSSIVARFESDHREAKRLADEWHIIFNSLQRPSALVDSSGVIVKQNSSYKGMFKQETGSVCLMCDDGRDSGLSCPDCPVSATLSTMRKHSKDTTIDGLSYIIEAVPVLLAAGQHVYVTVFENSNVKSCIEKARRIKAQNNALVDSTSCPTIVGNKRGKIVICNSAFYELFGVTKEDIPTVDRLWLALAAQTKEGLQDAMLCADRARNGRQQGTADIVLIDGRKIKMWMKPVNDNSGENLGTMCRVLRIESESKTIDFSDYVYHK